MNQRETKMINYGEDQNRIKEMSIFQDAKPVAGRPEISGGHPVNKQL